MHQIKKLLSSETGMKIVNLLFFLSMFLRNSGVILIAYAVWMVYLVFCIRKTSSKGVRLVYQIWMLFTAGMILLNLYFALHRR